MKLAKAPKLGAPEQAGAAAPSSPLARTREEALALSPRVTIDTRSIAGSIALKGARVDDVSLEQYRQTVDPTSPIITLLSPEFGLSPYYAELGYRDRRRPRTRRRCRRRKPSGPPIPTSCRPRAR